jgi:hypothetical protein
MDVTTAAAAALLGVSDTEVRRFAISGQTPATERQRSLRDLAGGAGRVVFSVDLFNEGVDVPAVDTVVMFRPTESPTPFLQQFGRGSAVARAAPIDSARARRRASSIPAVAATAGASSPWRPRCSSWRATAAGVSTIRCTPQVIPRRRKCWTNHATSRTSTIWIGRPTNQSTARASTSQSLLWSTWSHRPSASSTQTSSGGGTTISTTSRQVIPHDAGRLQFAPGGRPRPRSALGALVARILTTHAPPGRRAAGPVARPHPSDARFRP